MLALARVRRGRRTGLLTDAFGLPSFAHRFVTCLASGKEFACDDGVALPTDRTLPLTATPFTLAIALGFVRNEGDAWSWILDHLSRALDTLAPATGADTSEADLLRDCEAIVGAIGKRLGELPAILSRETSNPAFAPKVADASDAANWARKTEERIQTAFEGISRLQTWQRDQDRDRAQTLLSQSEGIVAAIRNLAKSGAGTLMTRIHGDFHLGQVLVASGDAYVSISRANRAPRSGSAAPKQARCAMSPAYFVPSTMPARRSSTAEASAPFRSMRRSATSSSHYSARTLRLHSCAPIGKRRTRAAVPPLAHSLISSSSRRPPTKLPTRLPTGRPGSVCPLRGWRDLRRASSPKKPQVAMADAQLELPCQLDWIGHLRSALTAIRSPRLGRTIREPVVSSARSCQAWAGR